MDPKELAEKIRTLRKAKGLTQEKLAAISGVARRVIQRIEKAEGSTTVASLVALGTALDTHFGPVNQQVPRDPLPEWATEIKGRLHAIEKKDELEVARLRKENEELRKIITAVPQEIYKSWPLADPLAQVLALFYLSGDENSLRKLEPAVRKKMVKDYLRVGLHLRPKNPSSHR